MGNSLLDGLETRDINDLCQQTSRGQVRDTQQGNGERTALLACLMLLDMGMESLFDALDAGLEILSMLLDVLACLRVEATVLQAIGFLSLHHS